MRRKKLIISTLKILSIIFLMVLNYCNKNIKAQVVPPSNQIPIKIDVFLYDFNDKYISLVQQNFEEIQKNNQGTIEFTFYDGMNDQSIQNTDIDSVLEQKNTNLILLNIVDVSNSKIVIDIIKEKGIPVILFNRKPLNIEDIKSYLFILKNTKAPFNKRARIIRLNSGKFAIIILILKKYIHNITLFILHLLILPILNSLEASFVAIFQLVQ